MIKLSKTETTGIGSGTYGIFLNNVRRRHFYKPVGTVQINVRLKVRHSRNLMLITTYMFMLVIKRSTVSLIDFFNSLLSLSLLLALAINCL